MAAMEHHHTLIGKLLLVIGTLVGGWGLLEEANLVLALVLKITGLISFGIYVVKNHDKFWENWYKLKDRFKKKS